jgi:hypothetical protein
VTHPVAKNKIEASINTETKLWLWLTHPVAKNKIEASIKSAYQQFYSQSLCVL